jgi:acyl-coenzyme A synthetase/AMP-(fatty) acid ligase
MNKHSSFLYPNIKNPIHWRVSEIILKQSSSHPNLKIIKFINGPEWTYNDLKIKSLQKANILKKIGLKRGETVTVFIQDPKEFILYWIASNFLGLIFVALNTAIKGNGLSHQIQISQSKYIIVEDQFYGIKFLG